MPTAEGSTPPDPAPPGPISTRRALAHALAAEKLRRLRPDLLSFSRAVRLEEAEELDFSAFPFQPELYGAFGDRGLPTVDVMKSAQCGISAAGVSLALFAGDRWGANVLYVLPTEDLAQDFSDTRVRRAIEDSPYLCQRVSSTDNKGLKRVGEAFLYFTGSASERQALSVPADVLVLDEYDRLDHRQVPKFRRRLSSPKSLRLERAFSNPSYPESGIHARFLLTDQREWLVTCPVCATEAPIAWEQGEGHHVDEERAARVCGRCARELSPGAIASGRWVAARSGASRRGYHVSRLIVPAEDVALLTQAHRLSSEEEVQAHYNFDLGLPYAPRGGSLPRELVLACRRDYPPDSYRGPEWVSAGVDVGKVLHVRISRWPSSGAAVCLFLGEVGSFEELSLLWARYGVNLGLVDERPEERKAREFLEAHRGRCLLLRWAGDEQRDPVVLDQARGLVVARRTAACDRLVAAVAEQRRLLPPELPGNYLSQMTAPHRVTETSAGGQKIGRYRSERADHYFFCELFDLLAAELRPVEAAGASGPAPESIRDQIRRRRGWR